MKKSMFNEMLCPPIQNYRIFSSVNIYSIRVLYEVYNHSLSISSCFIFDTFIQ
jgi:hypothetical protein